MARIEFVVSQVQAEKFSGGLLCIFEYAERLKARGHYVVVTPLLPSEYPRWFQPSFTLNLTPRTGNISVKRGLSKLMAFRRTRSHAAKNELKDEIGTVLGRMARYGSYNFRRALMMESYAKASQDYDITVATSFETAFPVAAYGVGRKYYFMQHYEPFFAIDFDREEAARTDALATYSLPLTLIANSSWLKSTLEQRHQRSDVHVNPNAIRQEDFFPDGEPASDQPFTVISYGGRTATWKGFADAAQAIRIARQSIPELRWLVYGDALLPPDNEVASYEHLGFISGGTLRRAYSRAHVLLASSWYESFPLFPIEAMACGAAVITTPYGTEDYAVDGHNALFVPPRDPEQMAAAIVRLHREPVLRLRLREAGIETGQQFTWTRAAQGLETILTSD